MKVLLTGASGVIGRSATTALLEAGHDVVGLARSTEAAQVISDLGADVAPGSLYDHDSLVAGMSGCDVVLNFATRVPVGHAMVRPGAWRANDRVREVGSVRVVAAAHAAGVPRVVQQSLSAVYADQGDDWVDEHSPVELTRAAEPIVVAEGVLDRFGREGGEAVVLRLGQVVGPEPGTRWLVRRARSGRPTGFGDPASWTHLLHVTDAGTAAVAALGVPPGVYNVGAEPCRRGELAEQLALAGGRLGGKFHSRFVTRLGGQRLEMFSRSQRVSSQRFADRSGWHPEFPKLTPEWFDGVLQRA